MKKKIAFLLGLMFMAATAIGCAYTPPDEVMKLQTALTNVAVAEMEDRLGIIANEADFEVDIAEKTGDQTFERLESVTTKNDIYLTGRFKGEPKDVLQFIVVYSPVQKKVLKTGIQTIVDEEVQFIEYH